MRVCEKCKISSPKKWEEYKEKKINICVDCGSSYFFSNGEELCNYNICVSDEAFDPMDENFTLYKLKGIKEENKVNLFKLFSKPVVMHQYYDTKYELVATLDYIPFESNVTTEYIINKVFTLLPFI